MSHHAGPVSCMSWFVSTCRPTLHPPPKGRVCIHAVLTTSPHLGACGHDQGAVLLHDLWHLVQRALVAMELPHLSGLGGGSQT